MICEESDFKVHVYLHTYVSAFSNNIYLDIQYDRSLIFAIEKLDRIPTKFENYRVSNVRKISLFQYSLACIAFNLIRYSIFKARVFGQMHQSNK